MCGLLFEVMKLCFLCFFFQVSRETFVSINAFEVLREVCMEQDVETSRNTTGAKIWIAQNEDRVSRTYDVMDSGSRASRCAIVDDSK